MDILREFLRHTTKYLSTNTNTYTFWAQLKFLSPSQEFLLPCERKVNFLLEHAMKA
jgi:hypothetical protein